MNPITALMQQVLDDVAQDVSGATAAYIPELAAADPDLLAFAIVGPRGRIHSVGDDEVEFTIQSISKPFVLAHVLSEVGLDAVLARVGAEPSGEPFNAISLEEGSGRPANPMVNAGAIATTGLVAGAGVAESTERIRRALSAFAGRELAIDDDVYRSESSTGDRNRALAHLMRSYGVVDAPVDVALETYFRQCSILVTVRDLAVMASTLALGGVNPRTGERVVSERVARDVLSIMSSCGMYDFSGQWLLQVGLPAKSGVSGGVLAVAPSQFGVAAFSPRLDVHGNSVRGQAIVQALAERMGLHLLEHHESISQPIVDISDTPDGKLVRLSGELGFASVEHVREVLVGLAAASTVGAVIRLDARELARTHPAALLALQTEVESLPVAVRFVA